MVKFIEVPEHDQEKKTKEKFKIVSLKVKAGVEFTPELVRWEVLLANLKSIIMISSGLMFSYYMFLNLCQFDEQKEFVAVERVLKVEFLDPHGQSSVRLH